MRRKGGGKDKRMKEKRKTVRNEEEKELRKKSGS